MVRYNINGLGGTKNSKVSISMDKSNAYDSRHASVTPVQRVEADWGTAEFGMQMRQSWNFHYGVSIIGLLSYPLFFFFQLILPFVFLAACRQRPESTSYDIAWA